NENSENSSSDYVQIDPESDANQDADLNSADPFLSNQSPLSQDNSSSEQSTFDPKNQAASTLFDDNSAAFFANSLAHPNQNQPTDFIQTDTQSQPQPHLISPQTLVQTHGQIIHNSFVQEPIRTDFLSIKPQYNFENFVEGKCNRLAVQAALAISEQPGTKYNPLFIYGGSGLGKTHLMHAVGNQLKLNFSGLKIVFVTGEKFVSDFVSDINIKKNAPAFRDKYRNIDVLMIDDIQFIAGKHATTEEVFNTFNHLHGENKQMVFSSDRMPKDIPDIDTRLQSRFDWGFTTVVKPPDYETRIAILRKKAQILRVNVPADVLGAMAECMGTNVREMEGLLNKVLMLAQLEDSAPSVDMVKEAIKDYTQTDEGQINTDDIIEAVVKLFSVDKSELIGKSRKASVVKPRQLCVYCMTEMLDLPLATIGSIFDGRDHATMLHARNKIAQLLKHDQKTRVEVDNIKNMVLKK
ncbi:MAG: chromosomal replication initiator protein DnaA, partial [Firmicutes bacterium]|nr:chromosomal replication initiator protein DnaA [Bacillota bacterium]